MPNWCSNILRVSGRADDVSVFVHAVQTVVLGEENDLIHRPCRTIELDFNKILPEPAEIAMGTDGLMNWRIANWGTKWNLGAGDVGIEHDGHDDGGVVYSFCTAWSPVGEVFMEKLGVLFPRLGFELEFQESGAAMEGNAVVHNGALITYESHDMEDDYGCDGNETEELDGSDDPLEN